MIEFRALITLVDVVVMFVGMACANAFAYPSVSFIACGLLAILCALNILLIWWPRE